MRVGLINRVDWVFDLTAGELVDDGDGDAGLQRDYGFDQLN
jgi:hypothetical protein